MIIYILFILLIIVITIECFIFYMNNDNQVKFKNILNKEECQDIINKVSKIKFDTSDESVDTGPELKGIDHRTNNNDTSHMNTERQIVSFPVYQIDIYSTDISIEPLHHNLWENTVKPLYNKKLKPLINKLPWTKGKKIKLNWAFIKRYKKSERTHMRSHFDTNYFTFNILLSDKNDFKGGDFYIFDKYYSSKYINIQDLILKAHDVFINQMGNNIPIVKDYDQGDILSFIGQQHLHGTLPVEEGERYVLVLFFNINQDVKDNYK